MPAFVTVYATMDIRPCQANFLLFQQFNITDAEGFSNLIWAHFCSAKTGLCRGAACAAPEVST
jgi:hypothetical protein